MIRAIIIDDEQRARKLLRNLVEQGFSDSIEIVAEGDDVDTGIVAIKKHQPDLVFLDIKMHKGSGFDLLQELKDVNFEVIFVTAYDQYAVKAFQFSAFGYLMKPIKSRDLNSVVDKLKNHIDSLKDGVNKRLKVLVENYGDDRLMKKLVITNKEGFRVSNIEDIIRLEGDGNYTNFVIEDGLKIMTSKSLGEYEELLNEHGFFRIHQSTIVNLRHVNGFIKGSGDKVEMSDGETFNVSRHRKPAFLKRFL